MIFQHIRYSEPSRPPEKANQLENGDATETGIIWKRA